jgi:hypothetical protein
MLKELILLFGIPASFGSENGSAFGAEMVS